MDQNTCAKAKPQVKADKLAEFNKQIQKIQMHVPKNFGCSDQKQENFKRNGTHISTDKRKQSLHSQFDDLFHRKIEDRDTRSQLAYVNRQRSFGDIITPQKLAKDIKNTHDDILGFSVNFTQNKASDYSEHVGQKLQKAKSFASHQRKNRDAGFSRKRAESKSQIFHQTEKSHDQGVQEKDSCKDPLFQAIVSLCERTRPFEHQKGLHLKAMRDICSKNWQKPIYDDLEEEAKSEKSKVQQNLNDTFNNNGSAS
jgi:hypothetical protein